MLTIGFVAGIAYMTVGLLVLVFVRFPSVTRLPDSWENSLVLSLIAFVAWPLTFVVALLLGVVRRRRLARYHADLLRSFGP